VPNSFFLHVDPTRSFEPRKRYDRGRLRYPSDLTDEEWSLVAPLIPPAVRAGRIPDFIQTEDAERRVLRYRAAVDFAECMRELTDSNFPDAECIRIVLDTCPHITPARSTNPNVHGGRLSADGVQSLLANHTRAS